MCVSLNGWQLKIREHHQMSKTSKASNGPSYLDSCGNLHRLHFSQPTTSYHIVLNFASGMVLHGVEGSGMSVTLEQNNGIAFDVDFGL